MAIGNKEVLPAIVVKIQKPRAPLHVFVRDRTEASLVGNIFKASSIVVIESTVILSEVRDQKVQPAVVIIVAHSDTHGRLSPSLPVDRTSGFKGDFFKRSVTFVAPEKIGDGVICHVNVRPSVVVVIDPSHAKPVGPIGIACPHLTANLSKFSATFIVIKEVREPWQTLWPASHGDSLIVAVTV